MKRNAPNSFNALLLVAIATLAPSWALGQDMSGFVFFDTPRAEIVQSSPVMGTTPVETEVPLELPDEDAKTEGAYDPMPSLSYLNPIPVRTEVRQIAQNDPPAETVNTVFPMPRSANLDQMRADYQPNRDRAPDFNLINRLAKITWDNAVEGRVCSSVMRCRGQYVKGNRSKGYCAAALKESLVEAGLCAGYFGGHAIQLHTARLLTSTCPGFQLSGNKDPKKAPAASVIIYKRSSHEYGHIEIKIPVTAQLLDIVRRDPHLKARGGGNLRVGDYLYCSDFCRATPTFGDKANPVVGIYTLK